MFLPAFKLYAIIHLNFTGLLWRLSRMNAVQSHVQIAFLFFASLKFDLYLWS